jgi:hypothetical protein
VADPADQFKPLYTQRAVHRSEVTACEFCGCVVADSLWGDHVAWHETLDMQASLLLAQRLTDLQGRLTDE